MKKRIFFSTVILSALALASCEVKKQKEVVAESGSEPLVVKKISLGGHPESVSMAGGDIFISNIGVEMKPTEKDGDGCIVKVDKDGNILSEDTFPDVKLNAPKGMAVIGDVLYVADIDRIVGVDWKTGKQVSEIDLSGDKMSFLNDLVLLPDGKIAASATDINQLFLVDPVAKTYSPIKTSVPIPGPNGLVATTDGKTLYVAGYSTDETGKGNGQLWKVDRETGATTPVSDLRSAFDGLGLIEDELYFSDWGEDGKSGSIRTLNFKTGEVTDVTRIPLQGVADFLIDEKTESIWIPSMLGKSVIHAGLKIPEKK